MVPVLYHRISYIVLAERRVDWDCREGEGNRRVQTSTVPEQSATNAATWVATFHLALLHLRLTMILSCEIHFWNRDTNFLQYQKSPRIFVGLSQKTLMKMSPLKFIQNSLSRYWIKTEFSIISYKLNRSMKNNYAEMVQVLSFHYTLKSSLNKKLPEEHNFFDHKK